METSTLEQMLASAERAVSSGDYASAEALLRQAASLQEWSLDPQHPDLASTLNNLGILCEKTDKLADAEECYQRACAIASASLGSEHPLVITSRNNLDEFCKAHGRSATAATQAIDVKLAPRVQDPADASAESGSAADSANTAPTSQAIRRRPPLGVAGAVMTLVLMAGLALWLMRMPTEESTFQQTSSGSTGAVISDTSSTSSRAPRRSQPTADARVVEASLCASLSTTGARWECAPASERATADSLFFYTRVAARTSTRIHHRWYLDGRLWRDVDLSVQANPSAGYRTYSRQRVNRGEWRVELVTADGVLLREERVAIP